MTTLFEECVSAFGQEVVQQDIAIWVLLGLGTLIVLVSLYLLLFTDVAFTNALILILVGAAFIVVSRTGQIPGISGSLSEPAFETAELQRTIRAGCYERTYAVPSDIPETVPSATVKVNTPNSELVEGLSRFSSDENFVWIFYAATREKDALALETILTRHGILATSAPDDFSQVVNKQPSGTTRVIFSSDAVSDLAQAIAEVSADREIGDVVLQGPYSSISRGPVQLQLY